MTDKIEFIGIGAARCGTSWIANVLRSHPKICISEPKEVRYFNRMQTPVGRLKGKINKNFDRDITWYLKRYSHAKPGQLKGEFSPVYLSDESAPSAIKACYPNVKLIACLRNPVDRAFSQYKLHQALATIADVSFEEALESEENLVASGMYASCLGRYLGHFNRDQILLLVFEDFIAEPKKGFQRIFEFLGLEVPADFDPSQVRTSQSLQRRSNTLHSAAFAFTRWLVEHDFGKAVDLLRAAGVHDLFSRLNSAPARPQVMSDSTRARLTTVYRDDMTMLEGLFDLNLGVWKQ